VIKNTNEATGMSLRSKVGLILMIVFLLYGLSNYGIQRFIVFPGFQSLENDEAVKNAKRVVQSIEREIHHLNLLCFDWGSWDDTYAFVESSSQAYVQANLVLNVFTGNRLNLIYFCDLTGKVVWGEIHDINTTEQVRINEFPLDAFPRDHPLLAFSDTGTPLADLSINGIFLTGQGPMLVASRPILKSNQEGPRRGTIIMGRLLDESMVETLISQTEVDFQVYPIVPEPLPVEIKNVMARITGGSKYVIETVGKDHLDVYTTIAGMDGKPVILIGSRLPRSITARGDATIRFAMYSIIAAGLGVLITMLLLLQRTILTPITRLTDHTLLVAETGNLSARLSLNRQDEIGTLAGEFDMMLAQLADTRNKLLEQSYYSGLAQITSGTLHHARNILMPMAGQISQAREKIDSLPQENIRRALSELESENIDPERQRALHRFLHLGSSQFLTILQEVSGKLSKVAGYVCRVEAALAEQDRFSHAERAVESLQLMEIVKKAATLVPQDFPHPISIAIDPGLSDLPAIPAERVVLTQVFASLLNNAAQSIIRTGKSSGNIVISGALDGGDDGRNVHIRVMDDGEGIDPGALEHVFDRDAANQGPRGSGLGLHWCANVLSTMHGRIYAESEGAGQGTCFHIVIPTS
jgi:sensor domain CHASE-containing protein